MSLHDTIKGAVERETPTVDAEDTLETALQKMTKADVAAMLVKAGGELVGIVNDTDILCCIANGLDLRDTRVTSIMKECQLITREGAKNPCVQLDENENVKLAIAIMNEAGVHHLLVSGSGGQIVGLVSAVDLLRQVVA